MVNILATEKIIFKKFDKNEQATGSTNGSNKKIMKYPNTKQGACKVEKRKYITKESKLYTKK